MAFISFAHPAHLFFLLLIPLMIFIHFFSLKSTRATALRFANFPAIARIKGIDFFSKNLVITGLSILVVLLLVLALSGMILNIMIDASSYSFVIALDASQSMEANDLLPNRMEAAKDAALEFVGSVPIATRMGVISFSGNSLIEQDLTDSKNLVKTAIKDVVVSDISGTDLFEAVITGTNLLKAEETRAIILLSDGQINVGSIADAIEYANTNQVVIHSIAVGTEEGGIARYGLSKLDENSLKALAYNTGGEFFRATDKATLVESFYNAIGKTRKKVGINLGVYLLIAAMILFTIEYFLISTKYRRLI